MTTKLLRRTAAAKDPLAVISRQLESYAERGVFRSYSRSHRDIHAATPARTQAGAEDRAEFHFSWLWNLPFQLTFERRKKAISFPQLLPNINPGSELEAELKAFIRKLSSRDRPEHRRLDPRRITVRYSKRGNSGSLAFVVAGNHYEYAVKKALNAVHEIFVGFLNVQHGEYMRENLRVTEET
jgi:hypothetical protein